MASAHTASTSPNAGIGPSGRSPDGPEEVLDPELIALPAPPQTRRYSALAVILTSAIASLGLLFSLRADLNYFFADTAVAQLGEVTGVNPASLEPNSYVTLAGTPMISRSVQYERMLSGRRYEVFPLAGQRNVFVQREVNLARQDAIDSHREFAGRLVTFSQLGGRASSIQSYFTSSMDTEVSGETFLLMVDETPGTYGWAIWLSGLLVLFVLVNAFLAFRWFAPLRKQGGNGALA